MAGGELRYVTLLHADGVGVPAARAQLTCAIEQHGGAVERVGGGDALAATFGLPRPDPSAARNAVRAGLALQAWAREADQTRLRIGIHAGEVLVEPGAGGAGLAPHAEVAETAARIARAAAPGRVWISRVVYEEVRRLFVVHAQSPIELHEGRPTLQPFEVVGERHTPLLDLPRFVGRESEWAALRGALAEAVAAHSLRVVLVRGPAGVGKSRLVWELRELYERQPAAHRFDVVQFDHSERLPSHGLASLIRSRFRLPVETGEDEVLARLRERHKRENPYTERGRRDLAIEFFAFVLGILRDDFHIRSLDGSGKWEGAFVEIKRWIEGWASRAPWVIILEDAQKGDYETAAFLDWALKLGWTAPVLVVVTLRDEDFGPDSHFHAAVQRWLAAGQATEIRLRELAPEALAEALGSMAEGQVAPGMARRIAEHTEGNPLFATEIVLLLKDQGLLARDAALETVTLPGTIREVMEARLERLGAPGKEVAKRGALVGRRFTREAVARIWQGPPQKLEAGLSALRETETVYEESSPLGAGETEFVFRHGRLQEAALARVPQTDRLQWLGELESWALGKLAALRERWEAAGPLLAPLVARSLAEWGKTWETSLWYELLGLLHRKHDRPHEAVAALTQAQAGASGVRRQVLARQLAELELRAGEAARALAALAQAEAPAPASDPEPIPTLVRDLRARLVLDPLDRWEALAPLGASLALELERAEVVSRLGRISETRPAFDSVAARIAELEGPIGMQLRVRWANAWVYVLSELLGSPKVAEQVCAEVRRQVDLERPALAAERLAFLQAEGNFLWRLGRYDAALRNAEQRLGAARATGNQQAECVAWNLQGTVHYSQGALERGRDCYEKSLAIARAIGHRLREAIALHNLGLVHCDQGAWDPAADHQRQYLALSRAIGNRVAEAHGGRALALVAMARREYAQAEEHLAQARRAAVENGWALLDGWTRGAQAQLGILRWLDDRRPEKLGAVIADLLACEESWSYCDDAGEFYATLALASWLGGDGEAGRAHLMRGRERVHDSGLVGRAWLEAAATLVGGGGREPALQWLRARGFVRAVGLLEQIGEARAMTM